MQLNTNFLPDSPLNINLSILENTKVERIWDEHEFLAYIGNNPVGYLRVEQVNIARALEVMPTVWHYKNFLDGWCFDTTSLEATWFAAHLHTRGIPASFPQNGSWCGWQDKDKRPDAATMQSDLALLDKAYNFTAKYKGWLRKHKDYCFVSWIEIEDGHNGGLNWRRQGIATKLYIHAATWLATKGLALYSSTCQSDSAKATWATMYETDLPITKSQKNCFGSKQFRYKLDLCK